MSKPDPLESFHEWLAAECRGEVRAFSDIMRSLQTMLDNGCEMTGLPTEPITCMERLSRLAVTGRAVRLDGYGKPDVNGAFWRWAEGRASPKVTQGSLFG